MNGIPRDWIIELLKVASAYDSRKPDEAQILAWSEAARRAGWTFERALDAIHEHYANDTDRIMPGHITAILRAPGARPSDTPVADVLQLPSAPPASAQRRAELMAQIRKLADRKAMP